MMAFKQRNSTGRRVITGAQRILFGEADKAITKEFSASPLAQECAQVLAKYPNGFACVKDGENYAILNRVFL